ncbi:hypothetical protein M5K25_000157 [Dendrobium thyrsiflorum]|uniref:Polygalacturonase n=1 Tax=Dendrobium thyrsiflorum TaxID=117978 RepID=A0ABD0VT48_DENTH
MASQITLLFYLLSFLSFSSTISSYNILNFGAKKGGNVDCVEAVIRAWKMACNSSSSPANIYIPDGVFLISGVRFNGPCVNKKINFMINGTLMAPSGYTDSSEWFTFDTVEGISINGGVFNGRGSKLWDCKLGDKKCPRGATSLEFTNSKDIEIRRLTSIDSELFHIVIHRCDNVNLDGLNIVGPKWSPNTDGIHVQMSTKVNIRNTRIKTGDDCISIGPGTSALWIERIICGPGHGISIGSLGKDEGLKEEGVHNVTVQNILFLGSDNGLRIKTWGSNVEGYVKGIIFKHVVMNNVMNPIIIDQNYCPHNEHCPGKLSISGTQRAT